MANVEPILHVPDVRATVAWYRSIGFELLGTNEPDGAMDWAKLRFGEGTVMFMEGGGPSDAVRREVDLYVTVNNIDQLFVRFQDSVEIVERLHDTFYGMREFIIRDINGFWVTFGEAVR